MAISLLSPAMYRVLNIAVCVVYPAVKTFTFLYAPHLPKLNAKTSSSRHPALYAHHLMYWAIYTIFTLLESLLLVHVTHVIPLFQELKLCLFYWLGSDNFKGAGYLFQRFCIKPVLEANKELVKFIDANVDKKGQAAISEFLKKLGSVNDVKLE